MSTPPIVPGPTREGGLPPAVRLVSGTASPLRIAPGARARLQALLAARGGTPQVLWLRRGGEAAEARPELAVVDRPAQVPPGFVLHEPLGIPVLLEARDEAALAGLRIEAAGGGALRLVRPDLPADDPAPSDGSCGTCASSAPVPAAFRMGDAPVMNGAPRRRGPSLPVMGQDVPALHP